MAWFIVRVANGSDTGIDRCTRGAKWNQMDYFSRIEESLHQGLTLHTVQARNRHAGRTQISEDAGHAPFLWAPPPSQATQGRLGRSPCYAAPFRLSSSPLGSTETEPRTLAHVARARAPSQATPPLQDIGVGSNYTVFQTTGCYHKPISWVRSHYSMS